MLMRCQTAEEFVEKRHELEENGRWSELILGEPVSLEQPPPRHGTAVLNITRALADYIQRTSTGYACFELGLTVARSPDTVYCPPISYFVSGSRWEEMDRSITETKPALVIEIASSRDRRKNIAHRVSQYLDWGVTVVWIIDTDSQQVSAHTLKGSIDFPDDGHLEATADWTSHRDRLPVLPGFRFPVVDIFREPDWMG